MLVLWVVGVKMSCNDMNFVVFNKYGGNFVYVDKFYYLFCLCDLLKVKIWSFNFWIFFVIVYVFCFKYLCMWKFMINDFIVDKLSDMFIN